MIIAPKQTCGQMEQKEDPNMSSWNHSHLILDKDVKNKHWGKTEYSTNLLGKTDFHTQKNEISLISITLVKINSN